MHDGDHQRSVAAAILDLLNLAPPHCVFQHFDHLVQRGPVRVVSPFGAHLVRDVYLQPEYAS